MRRVVLLSFVVVVALLIVCGCAGPKPGTVAKAGNYYITADELNKAVGNAKYQTFDEEFEARKKRAETLAQDKLILMAAYEAGLDKNPDVMANQERNKKNLMLNALYKSEIEVKAGTVTDDDVQKVYERMKELLHAKHILVKTEPLADSIYEKIQKGANFDELAKQYSEDKSNSEKGGDLGDFSALAMVTEFEDAAYALQPGSFSKPVKTRFGFHIIYLVERKPNTNIKSLVEEKDRITRSLQGKKTQDMAKTFVDKTFEDAGIQFNDAALSIILGAYKDATPKEPGQQPVVTLTDQQRQMQLFNYKSGTWTIGNFDSVFMASPPFRRPQLSSKEAVQDFVKMQLQGELLEKRAVEMNIESCEEYKKLYTEDIDKRMIDEYRKNNLYKDIEPLEDSVLAYYNAFPDSFMEEEQVQVLEIQVATADLAKKLISQLKGGTDFSKLAVKNTERSYTKAKGGDLGLFNQRRYPELFNAAKALKSGEIYPEPIPFQGKFSVIKLIATKPAEKKPYEQVKRMISNKLRSKMRQEAYDKWVETAKSKYGFKLYEDEIKKAIDKTKYETAAKPPQT